MIVIKFLTVLPLISLLVNCNHLQRTELVDDRIHIITENVDWSFFQDLDIIHQAIRLRHGVSELYPNETLITAARHRAVVRAWYENAPPPEEHDNDVAENVYYQSNPEDAVSAVKVLTNWYVQEEKSYNYENPIFTPNVQHFVNIVSKTTQQYGCGQARSAGQHGGGIYTVCLYSPPYQPGKESENIAKPLFDFKTDQFDFSMVDDLKVGLVSS
ncbi:uncharacterized protein LOC128388800 [Panonychus citri]|uniref:uncharacterized protein LOC128388800 n=1 Tax=Panonychus citri TaxID=50023 RepID=UPI002306F524|nr:uncharacterized protein LOC128388800 [Panonychus citri]